MHDNFSFFRVFVILYENLNGVSRQPSNGLTFNRQKRAIFSVNRQKSSSILTVNRIQGLPNFTTSVAHHGLLALKESLKWETSFHVPRYTDFMVFCTNLRLN